jgi:hypothetical protein
MKRRRIIPVSLAVLAIGAGAALWLGGRRQSLARAEQVAHLTQAGAAGATPIDPANLDGLPAPVARYLRWALSGRRSLRLVRLQQTGTLRTDTTSDNWMPFEAEHLVAPHAPAFLWNARVRIAPLLHVRVRDSYIDGRGAGHVALLSAFTVGSDAGTPEMNAGSLHRFLAEAVWYPTALLPGPALRWTAIDDGAALATLTDRGFSVSLEFRFAETGQVTGIYTPARWGSFDGGYGQRPWEGHFRNYQQRDGVFVPTEGDVGWYVDGEWRAVWRGTIVDYEAR